MKLVFIQDDQVVTDSITVSEVFNKRHNDVMRDIEVQIQKLHEADMQDWGVRNFAQTQYQHPQNKQWYPKYNLTEDAFAIVAMAYVTPEAMKMKVKFLEEFKRMRSQLTQPQLPQNYKEALIALIEQVDKTEKLEMALTEQAPKVALYDTAMSAGNNHTMERVSKTLGYGRNKLFAFLREQKVLRANNLPYQDYIDRGYFKVRQYSITHLTTGIENKTQTLVTPKGMAYIHNLLVKHGLVGA